MKKIFLLFLVIVSKILFSQESSFSMNDKYFTDYVVVEQDGNSAKQLYDKTIEWINRNYKDPDKVILGKIENEYIRFEGYINPFACKKVLGSYQCEEGRYQIEISFKQNKYKFDVIKMETYTKYDGYNQAGWRDIDMQDTSFYYRNGKIRPMYASYPKSLSDNMNEINQSLSDYISGKSSEASKDW